MSGQYQTFTQPAVRQFNFTQQVPSQQMQITTPTSFKQPFQTYQDQSFQGQQFQIPQVQQSTTFPTITPNPFMQFSNQFSSGSAFQNQYAEPVLLDEIKKLNLQGVFVYGEKDLVTAFGEDCCGIDICCVNQAKIIAIKKDSMLSAMPVKDIALFIYSCLVIEKSLNRKVDKIFITILQKDIPTNTAINRNGIKYHINANSRDLISETVQYVRSQFM
jgi:hypothetical protein